MAGSGTTNIQLCGRFALELSGREVASPPTGQLRLLVAFLLVNRYRSVRRDELLSVLWPDALPADPDSSLSALLSRARRIMGEALRGRAELRLVLPADAWVDLEAASEAIHRAESAVAAGDWAAAYGPSVVARCIAGRPFLAGDEGPWIAEVRASIEDILVRALECDIRSSLGIGGAEAPIAVRSGRELVERAPLRESGHRLLMEALEAAGDAPEALRVHERLRCLLRDELGVAPSRATRQVHARLLEIDPPPP